MYKKQKVLKVFKNSIFQILKRVSYIDRFILIAVRN